MAEDIVVNSVSRGWFSWHTHTLKTIPLLIPVKRFLICRTENPSFSSRSAPSLFPVPVFEVGTQGDGTSVFRLSHFYNLQTTVYVVSPLVVFSPFIPVILMGLVNVRWRNAVLMAAFRAFPNVVMIIEAFLRIQIGTATITPPVDVRKPFTHCFLLLSLLHHSPLGMSCIKTVFLSRLSRLSRLSHLQRLSRGKRSSRFINRYIDDI